MSAKLIKLDEEKILFADVDIAAVFLGQDITNIESLKFENVKTCKLLYVYAHSYTKYCNKRSDFAGLQKLEQAIIELDNHDIKIIVFGFLTKNEYGVFSYLTNNPTIIYKQLPLCHDQLFSEDDALSTVDVRERQLLRLKASERQLELTFATERHKFIGLAAAVRIYLGKVAIHYKCFKQDYDEIKEELKNFIERANKYKIPIDIDIDNLIIKIKKHHEILKRINIDLPVSYSIKIPKCKVWMLDDNAENHMWDIVLKAIFGDTNVKYVKSWNEFKEWDVFKRSIIDNTVDNFLIVDCNLGENNEIGIELLPAIRSVLPEINIIMMSAFDDAETALLALRAGANSYFVKEIGDYNDRSSINYYCSFIKRFKIDSKYRNIIKLWHQYLKSTHNCSELYVTQILISFYFMFYFFDMKRWGYLGLSIPEERKNAYLISVVNLCQIGEGMFFKDEQIAIKVRHGYPITYKDAYDFFEKIINANFRDNKKPIEIKLHTIQPYLPRYSPYTIDDLRADGTFPGVQRKEMRITHDDATIRATDELLRGINCINKEDFNDDTLLACNIEINETFIKKDHDILLMDYEINNWILTLKSIYPNAEYYSFQKEGLKGISINHLKKYSVIIMDLKMPTIKDGLWLLQQLRDIDPSIPIIVISASTDYLVAERCLQYGAMDYICKALPYSRDFKQSQFFLNRILKSIDKASKYGKGKIRNYNSFIDKLTSLKCLQNTSREEFRIIKGCTFNSDYLPEGNWVDYLKADLYLLRLLLYYYIINVDDEILLPIDVWRKDIYKLNKSEMIFNLIILTAARIIENITEWEYSLRTEPSKRIKRKDNKDLPYLAKNYWNRNAGTILSKRNALIHGLKNNDSICILDVFDTIMTMIRKFSKLTNI